MRSTWMICTLWLAAILTGERIFAVAQSPAPGDDLYLDDQQSGDYPVDDDDFTSGSGSGTGEVTVEESEKTRLIPVLKALPTQDSTKDSTPRADVATSREAPRNPVRTEPPALVTDEPKNNVRTHPSRSPGGPFEVRTESLFQRTEVLAAVIAGGVIGFLFAIFLILLLVYRMRKKDEGSYDLGERKPSGAAYQKAPTKEFYA
ncbi:syndecan-2 [Paramormyrops kingsleyae]|uniref:Syndecan n=1 Tax=Paramormyrops kingsleyae TaxID=1676925 RepID=A0A3B3Q4N5_9TELE|nr:syndecan-2-like [Paramormyrops kingsleyae]